MNYEYNPVVDLNSCLSEIIDRSESITLDETKALLIRVEKSANKAVNCARRGMYYRHWCGFLSYFNGVIVEIGFLMENHENIPQSTVNELRDNALKGLYEFAFYVTRNLPKVIEILEIVEPVFTNTVLAFKALTKCLGEGLLIIIKEGIRKMEELRDATLKFFKDKGGDIFVYTIFSATTAGIISRFATTGACSVTVGAGTALLQHCVLGGIMGFGAGLVVGVAKEGYCYLKERKKRQRNRQIKNLMFTPEVSAKEAEKRGLEEIQIITARIIKQLKSIIDKETRIEFSHAYCIVRGNMLELQAKIPKVPNTTLYHED